MTIFAPSTTMTSSTRFCLPCWAARQGELRICSNCAVDYVIAEAASAPPPASDPLDATTVQSAVTSPPSEPPPPPTPADEPGRPWIKWALIAVGALLVIGFIGSLLNDNDGVAGASPSAEASASEAEETPGPESQEPAPSSEPPTPVPTPVATPSPSTEPEPEFADIELSGTGNAVPRFEIPESSAAIAEISHAGGANFVVWAIDSGGEQTDLLVNTIGNYAGTVLFDEAAGSHSAAFEVEADGSWTITIRPVGAAFKWDGASALTGSGDDVALLDPPSSGLMSTTLTHSGDGNFIVYGYSASETDLLVNEIGAFSGEVLLADGTFLFEINATGAWTVSPPQ